MTLRKADRFSDTGPQTLRDALYQLVHQSEIPAKHQAEQLNVPHSYLCDAANENEDPFCYQLRYLIPHTKIANNPVVVDYIERVLGRVAVPILSGPPTGRRMPAIRTPEALARALLQVMKEGGDAAGVVSRSLKDGRVTRDEARRCRKEVWELIQEAAVLARELDLLLQESAA
jgi:hypothetical protein